MTNVGCNLVRRKNLTYDIFVTPTLISYVLPLKQPNLSRKCQNSHTILTSFNSKVASTMKMGNVYCIFTHSVSHAFHASHTSLCEIYSQNSRCIQ